MFLDFKTFIVQKRTEGNISARWLAKTLDISDAYMYKKE